MDTGGVERTLKLLIKHLPPNQHWAGMRKDVATFINNCPQCQFMQPSKLKIRLKAKSEPFNNFVSKPWQLIALDSMGPFPEDENGNNYIIVVIDVFSRFVELYAVPQLSAKCTAQILIEYTSRYATPVRLYREPNLTGPPSKKRVMRSIKPSRNFVIY